MINPKVVLVPYNINLSYLDKSFKKYDFLFLLEDELAIKLNFNDKKGLENTIWGIATYVSRILPVIRYVINSSRPVFFEPVISSYKKILKKFLKERNYESIKEEEKKIISFLFGLEKILFMDPKLSEMRDNILDLLNFHPSREIIRRLGNRAGAVVYNDNRKLFHEQTIYSCLEFLLEQGVIKGDGALLEVKEALKEVRMKRIENISNKIKKDMEYVNGKLQIFQLTSLQDLFYLKKYLDESLN